MNDNCLLRRILLPRTALSEVTMVTVSRTWGHSLKVSVVYTVSSLNAVSNDNGSHGVG